VPTIARLLQGFRDAGLPVIHTRECHKPDLSDLPDAKRDRGNPSLRIGDPGPMGRILVDGEQGAEIIPDDATESYFPAYKTATIEMITAQGGIVGWAATTDKILEAIYA